MRALVSAIACALLVTSCVSTRTEAGVGCTEPPSPGSPEEGTLAVHVDRADLIAVVSVVKVEDSPREQSGAKLVTLHATEVLKGTAPSAEFVVDDGPCPVLGAHLGDSFVAFLTNWTYFGYGLRPIGLPMSALRATSTRTLSDLANQVRAIRPLDASARDLLTSYGWKVTAPERAIEFDLPPVDEFANAGRELRGAAPAINGQPLDVYAAASSDVGLDMRASAGKHVELLSFWLEHDPPSYAEGTPFGEVLISDRRIVGAWINVFPQAGPFSLRDRQSALSSRGAPASFPPKNRFPSGVNVARSYGLVNARSIAYKTGGGASGEITDAARIRAIASALDAQLPTGQAVWDQSGTPTTYYLHFVFDSSVVSLQYEAATGVLSVLTDGYEVRPGAAFAAVIATIK
jgi:uncharacterized protein DUF4830